MSIYGTVLESQLEHDNASLSAGQTAEECAPIELIGESSATKRLRLQIDRIGPHFRMLLLQGEIGTGKELVARALHERSRGDSSRFSSCYGAALSESVGGAFDEAGSPWYPLIRRVDGTIFLDGVEEMTLQSQGRLVELIDSWPRSSMQTRMIASSGQDMKKLLGAGRFRADLYHRLATIEITIEPLRKRREDIQALAIHFLRHFSRLYEKEVNTIDPMAMQRLHTHDWPGNVRELENTLRNAVLRSDETILEQEHLGSLAEMKLLNGDGGYYQSDDHHRIESLQEVVNRHVQHVLELCNGNKVRAAELLGISRSTLYRMLDGLEVTNGRVA